MRIGEREIRGCLIDLDGVLYVGDQPIPGAMETIRLLNSTRLPRSYLTNTTTKTVGTLQSRLRHMGFDVATREILTAPEAARVYLESKGRPLCRLFINNDVLRDFLDFKQSDTDAQMVVIGDIGSTWTYDLLNNIFRLIMNGAELVALHRNRFWRTEAGLQLDIGGFVTGLEYVTGKSATVLGKPSPQFFASALSRLGLPASQVASIGDDIENDVGAAQALGMAGVLVKTGKYRQVDVEASKVKPDLVLDSIADLGALLKTIP